MHKYVVSSTLDDPAWANSTILRGPLEDDVRALKEAPGKDIVATGSTRMVHSLIATGLVDEYRLFVSAALLSFPLLLSASLSACSASASFSATTSRTISASKLAATVQKQLMDSNPDLKVTDTTCDETKKIATGGKTACSTKING